METFASRLGSRAAVKAFICTYFAEVAFYMVRKAPSIVKAGWQADPVLKLDIQQLGLLDTGAERVCVLHRATDSKLYYAPDHSQCF